MRDEWTFDIATRGASNIEAVRSIGFGRCTPRCRTSMISYPCLPTCFNQHHFCFPLLIKNYYFSELLVRGASRAGMSRHHDVRPWCLLAEAQVALSNNIRRITDLQSLELSSYVMQGQTRSVEWSRVIESRRCTLNISHIIHSHMWRVL